MPCTQSNPLLEKLKRSPVSEVLEMIPLPIFLLCVEVVNPSDMSEWLIPYLLPSIAAILVTIFLQKTKGTLNRLFVGINLYLISGAIGVLANFTALNLLYGQLEAAGMLVWIALVGIAYTVLSPKGFIGLNHKDNSVVVRYSLLLLAVTGLAITISLFFKGSRLLSEIVPFMTLFTVAAYLKNKAQND